MYIHLLKKILYAKLTYCDYPNKNVEHLDLRITKIWIQPKKKKVMLYSQYFYNNSTTNSM